MRYEYSDLAALYRRYSLGGRGGEGRGERDLGRINECKSINPPSGVPSDRRELIHSEMGKEKGKLEQEGEQKEGYGPSNIRQCRTLWKPLNHSETL